MATQINRYTNVSIPRYTPRTLQELMIAPAYMRGQHDTLDVARGELEAQLAQYDSLSEHDKLLAGEQKKLYDEMTKQGDLLESEGFSPSSKSAFIRFNKQYQQVVGPTGQIGKIQSAKASFKQERDDLLKNATVMGFSPREIQDKIDAKRGEYEAEFNRTGNVVDFEAPLPPSFEDLEEDIKTWGSKLGSETTEKLQKGLYKIIPDPSGLYILDTITGSRLKGTNADNIKKAIEFLKGKWTGEGLGAESAEWQGMEETYILQQIKDGLGLQLVTVDRDLRQQRLTPLNKFGDIGSDVVEYPYKLGILRTTQVPDPTGDVKYDDMTDNIEKLEGLVADETITPQQESELSEKVAFRVHVDKKLSENPRYVRLTEGLKPLEDEYWEAFNKPELYFSSDPIDNGLATDISTAKRNSNDSAVIALEQDRSRHRRNKLQELKKVFTDNKRKVQRIQNKENRRTNITKTEYVLLTNENKYESNYKVYQKSLQRLISGGAAQYAEIESVTVADGTEIGAESFRGKDRDKLLRLLANAEQNSLEFISYTPESTNGYPGYTVRIPAEALHDFVNLPGHGNKVGLAQEDLVMSFTFNEPSFRGIRTANTFVLEEFAKADDGAEVIFESFKTMEKQAYKGKTWDWAIKEELLGVNTPLYEVYMDRLREWYDIDSDSTAADVEAAQKELNKERI